MFAVTVHFRLRPGRMADFLPKMVENARASRERESGCRQFDVATDPSRPDEVFLYELYADAAAFDAHLQSAHFRDFDAATRDMIDAKQVWTWAEVRG